MEEFSTAPIPGSSRAEDQRRPPPQAARRHLESRPRLQSLQPEANEQEDDAPENSEPKHHLDISV
jgi:hemolysin activation/secretion protein